MTYGERATANWTTPKHHFVQLTYRLETSDWNTISSVMLPHDEYGLAALDLCGRAADIGAHIGSVTIALLMDNPNLVVTAVEPIPDNVELLHENLERNGVADRCHVINAAVGKGKSTIIRYGYTGTVSAEHHAYIGNSALVYPEDGSDLPHKETKVPVLSLKELGPVGFVKIDCEGGEWGFLAGDVSGIGRIHGEAHPVLGHRAPDMADILAATHDVTFSGQNLDPGPCGFVAVAR